MSNILNIGSKCYTSQILYKCAVFDAFWLPLHHLQIKEIKNYFFFFFSELTKISTSKAHESNVHLALQEGGGRRCTYTTYEQSSSSRDDTRGWFIVWACLWGRGWVSTGSRARLQALLYLLNSSHLGKCVRVDTRRVAGCTRPIHRRWTGRVWNWRGFGSEQVGQNHRLPEYGHHKRFVSQAKHT